jgi:hypothetical protein
MIKNTKLRSEGVKRARELIYTAERQASRDVGLAGLRLKPGSSHLLKALFSSNSLWFFTVGMNV